MQLSADYRTGNRASFQEVDSPEWDDIETAIRKLDQSTYTEVTLAKGDEAYMSISGGKGMYFLFIWEDERNLLPFNKAEPDELAKLVSGGQLIAENRRFLLGLDDAVLAAKHYYETGRPSPLLKWQEA